MSEVLDVAIVGAGISGLAAAWECEKLGAKYRVFEATDRVGGNIRTELRDGFLIEHGPDGFVTGKPDARQLCIELGLEDELIETIPENRRVYVVKDNALVPMPRGMFLAVPTDFDALESSGLLSAAGVARVRLEPTIPRRGLPLRESIHAFAARRLGDEVANLFAGSLLAGIHAGNPHRLGVEETFPQLVALERDYGSLVVGGRALLARRTPNASAFASLRRGMSRLPDALVARLPSDAVLTHAHLDRVSRSGTGWEVHFNHSRSRRAKCVLWCAPADDFTRMIAPFIQLDRVPVPLAESVSSAVVHFGFDRADVGHPLDASGFIAPHAPGAILSAATWSSSKYPGRAPGGRVLVRVFVRGRALRGRDSRLRKPELVIARSLAELGPLIGLRAGAPAHVSSFHAWIRASPQMSVGHANRVHAYRKRLAEVGGLEIATAGWDGVGIPDCIRHARAAVRQLLLTA